MGNVPSTPPPPLAPGYTNIRIRYTCTVFAHQKQEKTIVISVPDNQVETKLQQINDDPKNFVKAYNNDQEFIDVHSIVASNQ